MRTLRLSLAGVITLALLGNLPATVVAQSSETTDIASHPLRRSHAAGPSGS